MSLPQIRKRIDYLDGEILKLIHERLGLAFQTKPFKSRIYDRVREREILGHLKKRTAGYPLLREEFIVSLFKAIMKESRRIQGASGPDKNKEVQP